MPVETAARRGSSLVVRLREVGRATMASGYGKAAGSGYIGCP